MDLGAGLGHGFDGISQLVGSSSLGISGVHSDSVGLLNPSSDWWPRKILFATDWSLSGSCLVNGGAEHGFASGAAQPSRLGHLFDDDYGPCFSLDLLPVSEGWRCWTSALVGANPPLCMEFRLASPTAVRTYPRAFGCSAEREEIRERDAETLHEEVV